MKMGGPEVVTITKAALESMLQPSPILSIEEQQALKKEKEKLLDEKRAQAKERKLRMLQVRCGFCLLNFYESRI